MIEFGGPNSEDSGAIREVEQATNGLKSHPSSPAGSFKSFSSEFKSMKDAHSPKRPKAVTKKEFTRLARFSDFMVPEY